MIRNTYIQRRLRNRLANIMSGGGELWTPEQITTIGWWDTSDEDTITESGGSVSQLDDLSGNDNHMAQLEASRQPTTGIRTIGGLNVLDYDETTSQYLLRSQGAFVPSSGNIMVHAVFDYDSASSARDSIFATRDPGNVRLFKIEAASNTQFNGAIRAKGVGDITVGYANQPHNDPAIFSAVMDFDSSVFYGYVNGTDKSGDGAYTTKLTESQSVNLMRDPGSAGESPDGGLGEVIVCEAVDETTRQLIEGYLAWKWGLVAGLPSDHPYKNAPPYVLPETPGGFTFLNGDNWTLLNGDNFTLIDG